MKKILITGGLGYIGMELCKIYSGKSKNYDVTVIDNNFFSSRIIKLKNWNIKFVQADILNKSEIQDIVKNADILYHLAGITDVGTTKKDSDSQKDKEIRNVGIKGSQNIIKLASKKSKIVFPSTHVVYEGVENINKDINEEFPPKPLLAYSKSKYETELDLKNSKKNFVILRLGSVYGLSDDSTRLNIMANLFAKLSSMSGELKLYGGGKQLKSLVSVKDVARCLEFVGENPDINNETFNCVNENISVENVAKICKTIKPEVKITKTDDLIPNKGYGLSNEKIKKYGFKFLYDIENSLKEMIDEWSFVNVENFNEIIEKGKDPYIDKRGTIENYYFDDPINMIGLVESKKGSIRGNHFHPIQTQKCLLVSGKYISVTKNLLDDSAVVETRIVKQGDLSIIPPNVAHTMIFLEDSVLMNLVIGDREHDNYGITHTFKHNLVDKDLADFLIKNYKQKCRSCNESELEMFLSLGLSPLANNLLNSENNLARKYPLELVICKNLECFNVQLSVVVPPDEMFDEYLYVSSTTESFKVHFEKLCTSLVNEIKLNKKSFVVDIGSNDGIFLKPLKEKGIRFIGIEPAKNIAKIANENNLETLNSYFDQKISKKIENKYGKADLVTAFNVFAHSDKLKDIAKNASDILKGNGVFLFEVQYFLDTLKDLTFDNIYHEHTNYWTLTSLLKFFEDSDLKIYKVEKINTHGGSIRVYCSKNSNQRMHGSVKKIIDEELEFGINNFNTYIDFSKQVNYKKSNSLKKINDLISSGRKLVGFGAPAKATTLLNFYGLNKNQIQFTIDENTLKQNKFIPGTGIKIISKNSIDKREVDKVIVLAWNYFDEIVSKNRDQFDKDSFISLN